MYNDNMQLLDTGWVATRIFWARDSVHGERIPKFTKAYKRSREIWSSGSPLSVGVTLTMETQFLSVKEYAFHILKGEG